MPRFVIHFHKSKRPHYDLRLELDKVLKSWALPKMPPKAKGLKRLAIQVDDHALSYINFKGIIEEGYGKGKVKIWDKGSFTLIDRKPNKIVFSIKGKKLKDEYVLVRFKPRQKTKSSLTQGKNWLFFRKS